MATPAALLGFAVCFLLCMAAGAQTSQDCTGVQCPPCASCPALPACPTMECPAVPPCVPVTQPAPAAADNDDDDDGGGLNLPNIPGPKRAANSPPSTVMQVCCFCSQCPEPSCNSTACPTGPACNSTATAAVQPPAGRGGLSARGVERLIGGLVGILLGGCLIWSIICGRRERRNGRRQRRRAPTVRVTVDLEAPSNSAASSTPSADDGSDSDSSDEFCC